MDFRLFFALSLSVFILLFGCAASPPSSSANNGIASEGTSSPPAVNERTGANVGAEPSAPAPPAAQKYTCALSLSPETIYARDATTVTYNVYSPTNTKFTFNCGDEERGITVGGLISGSRLCNFNTPGKIIVRIKADGVACAEKTLTVNEREAKAKSCSVDEKTIVRRLEDHYYSATVLFSGFEPNSTIVWSCGNSMARTIVGEGAFGEPAAMKEIYMDFGAKPTCDYITVTVGGMDCGKIPTN